MLAMRRSAAARGFTLIELLVTIAVIAIFSALAGPSFRDIIAAQRARSATAGLAESLWLARSEALKRNANVSFTVANGTGSPWNVMVGATPLHTQDAATGVVWSGGGTFTFNPYGRLTSGGGSKVQVTVSSTGIKRCVTVSSTGRATVEEGPCP
jgi:type IV fimbrial biogenesis protein FimT